VAVLRRTGRVSFLRVHRLGGGFGPNDDFIDVEAVAQVTGEDEHSFGMTLRDDEQLPAHQGMLELLRDGLIHDDLRTTVDYALDEGRSNGILMRVELRRT
jgi:hypothetical protein